MTAIDPIAALAAQTKAGHTDGTPRNRLGQEQFLELMIAQIRNQDPFKPTDPAQFLGQLAQFGTVSGIQDMQGSIGALSDSLRSSQVLDGATLVGRRVLAATDTAPLAADGALRGLLEVPSGATRVELAVRDHAGQLVRRFTVPAQGALTEFAWDGISASGTRAPAGDYSISAVATVGDRSESVPTLLESRIDSVTIDTGGRGLILNTGLGTLSLSDVRRVM
ncbi:MAG: flagellar hook assembly protein FlgD [Gammaproteobacteria bacterium]|nr:flagellar hook assembly protein FlgD [Gammaproteobacteria bacterium]